VLRIEGGPALRSTRWKEGVVSFGPLRTCTPTDDREGYDVVVDSDEMAINAALLARRAKQQRRRVSEIHSCGTLSFCGHDAAGTPRWPHDHAAMRLVGLAAYAQRVREHYENLLAVAVA
jgi:hypothetical protein